ncbi:MAG TPA: type II toxin-antitoxin system VapC family toxin [Caulobacteraceae bacterium]|nr:type II toxin-antitoxin system VapC family toxin [Caulobacteraceae bacterium]
MMAVDASAALAILLDEEDAARFEDALIDSGGGLMTSVNFWEVLVRAEVNGGAEGREAAEDLCGRLNIQIVDCGAAEARNAATAFATFGRRAAGGLNLGDCFAYALAAEEGDGLLFKGNDFPKTDIKPAL